MCTSGLLKLALLTVFSRPRQTPMSAASSGVETEHMSESVSAQVKFRSGMSRRVRSFEACTAMRLVSESWAGTNTFSPQVHEVVWSTTMTSVSQSTRSPSSSPIPRRSVVSNGDRTARSSPLVVMTTWSLSGMPAH